MSSDNRQADQIDVVVRARHARSSALSALFGFGETKAKWKGQKGPNPLTMMGLDRS